MSSVYLAVRSGHHRGAVVRLSPGIHLVGRSMDNDIVLSDPALAPTQLALRVDKDSLVLTARAPEVELDTRVLSIGQEEVVAVRHSHLKMADVELLLINHRCPRSLKAETASSDNLAGSPRRALATLALAGLVGCSVVIGLGGHHSSKSVDKSSVGDDPITHNASLEAMPTMEQIMAINQLLTSDPRWQHLRLRNSGGGSGVGLDGIVTDRSDLEALLQQPLLRTWSLDASAVAIARETEQRAREFTREPKLQAEIDRDGRLAFSGRFSTREGEKRFALLQQELGSRMNLGASQNVALPVAQHQPVQIELPVKVTSVNLAMHYFETAEGNKHFVGSSPAPGLLVSAIESHRIIFEIAGRLVDFPLP
jgi:Inner membrane component of T3SS, cytoplasmic domain